jgi:uncharacterized RDD family membrane protein YckC
MNKYDTFWPRFFALFIDGIVLSLISFALTIIPQTDSKIPSIFYSFLTTNIPYMYVVLMIGKYGQTLGKMVMSIKVVDNISEEKIGYYQSFMREAVPISIVNTSIIIITVLFTDIHLETFELSTLGYIMLNLPSGMLTIWSILEIVTMLTDEKSRALHDKIADTVVVRAN